MIDEIVQRFSDDALRVLRFTKDLRVGFATEALIYALMRVADTTAYRTFLAQTQGRGEAIVSFYQRICADSPTPFALLDHFAASGFTEDFQFLFYPHLFVAGLIAKSKGDQEITPRHMALAVLSDERSPPQELRPKNNDSHPNNYLLASGIDPESLWTSFLNDQLYPIDQSLLEGNFQLLVWPAESGFKVYRLEQIGGHQIQDSGSSATFRSNVNVISHTQLFRDADIEELEWLINNRRARERDLQHFFESHPNFLLGARYSYMYPEVCLTNADRDVGDLRPDFILQSASNDTTDIWDIKLPFANIAKGSRKRRLFSAHVWDAIAQLHEYRDYFDDSTNRRFVEDSFGLHVFKPQLAVVIGRNSMFRDHKERAKSQRKTDVRIVTYDDVLGLAKHGQAIVSK